METRSAITTDYEGADYRDLEAARDDAIEAARQIMSWAVRDGKQPDGQSFVITDEGASSFLSSPSRTPSSRPEPRASTATQSTAEPHAPRAFQRTKSVSPGARIPREFCMQNS
jgi:hypothetical protein